MIFGGQGGAGGGRGGGRGQGQGSGRGQGRGQGQRRGKGMGPGGQCVCPSCGATVKHEAGVPCYSIKCPKCGTEMTR